LNGVITSFLIPSSSSPSEHWNDEIVKFLILSASVGFNILFPPWTYSKKSVSYLASLISLIMRQAQIALCAFFESCAKA